MTHKLSRLIAASCGALTILTGAAVYAHDMPLSVNDAGPVAANHEAAPSNAAPAVGRSGQRAQPREVHGSDTVEVQTPSSVNESAPGFTGNFFRR